MTPSNLSIPLGLCQCGCGRKTRIAAQSHTLKGTVKGLPLRFINGHNKSFHDAHPDDFGPFKINGEPCRLIPLTKGLYAIISASRYDEVAAYRWSALYSRTSKSFYAITSSRENGKQTCVYMHRLLLGLQKGDRRQADHKEPGTTLDNRDSNLRIATPQENLRNQKRSRVNTSGYKGVCWHKGAKKWAASICISKRYKHLGLFLTPEAAHAAYCNAAKDAFGEFARAG